MTRRAAGTVAVMLWLLVGAQDAAAETPPGPRLATVELIETKGSERDENATPPIMSLSTLGPTGAQRHRLARGKLEGEGHVVPFPFYGPAWSSDGGLVAFSATVGERRSRIYVVAPDGSEIRPLPATERATNPVFSPDGHTLAFARTQTHFGFETPRNHHDGFYSSTTTWIVDLAGGEPRRLTRWRNGLSNVPARSRRTGPRSR